MEAKPKSCRVSSRARIANTTSERTCIPAVSNVIQAAPDTARRPMLGEADIRAFDQDWQRTVMGNQKREPEDTFIEPPPSGLLGGGRTSS